jgi:hypothetical protein
MQAKPYAGITLYGVQQEYPERTLVYRLCTVPGCGARIPPHVPGGM